MSRRAFTLIELLVVIAIIAILASILFPVFAQAKAASKQAANVSNLRQLAFAGRMYALDTDGLYPSRDSLGGAFIRAIDDPFGLPAVLGPYTKNRDVWYAPNSKPSLRRFGVGYSWNISAQVLGNDIDLVEGGTSELLLAWDAFNIQTPAIGTRWGTSGGRPALVPVTPARTETSTSPAIHCTAKGGRGYTVVYGDSHVGSITVRSCPGSRR